MYRALSLWKGTTRRPPCSVVAHASSPKAKSPPQPSAALDGVREWHEDANIRAPRFIVTDEKAIASFPKAEGSFFKIENASDVAHIKALRLRPGDKIELGDGKGNLILCELEAMGPRGSDASVRAVEEVRFEEWPGVKFELVVGCTELQGSRADWLIEKAVEMGAYTLRPLLSERSGLSSSSSSGGKGKGKGGGNNGEGAIGKADIARVDRWLRVAQAANQQSLRSHAMRIEDPISVSALADKIRSGKQRTFIAAGGAPPLRDVLGAVHGDVKPSETVYLIIGPPGDFTIREVEALAAAGAQPVGLGDLRLRTETAALSILTGARLMLC